MLTRLLKKARLRRWNALALAAAYPEYASLGGSRSALHMDLFEQFSIGEVAHPRRMKMGSVCVTPAKAGVQAAGASARGTGYGLRQKYAPRFPAFAGAASDAA